MEFQGKQRAERYSIGTGSVQSYNDFLNGYNRALIDSKAPEMLEMLIRIMNTYDKGTQTYIECQKLIKEVTEL